MIRYDTHEKYFTDCCEMGKDQTICEDCLCHVSKQEFEKINQSMCGGFKESHLYIGDGICNLELNTKEFLFDVGDCCLDEPICESNLVTQICPDSICISSNIYCIPEEIGQVSLHYCSLINWPQGGAVKSICLDFQLKFLKLLELAYQLIKPLNQNKTKSSGHLVVQW